MRRSQLEQRIESLAAQVSAAELDRDYYRAQRDRWKEEAVEAKQSLRQVLVAVESDLPKSERLDSVLRIARRVAGP